MSGCVCVFIFSLTFMDVNVSSSILCILTADIFKWWNLIIARTSRNDSINLDVSCAHVNDNTERLHLHNHIIIIIIIWVENIYEIYLHKIRISCHFAVVFFCTFFYLSIIPETKDKNDL